MAGDGSGCHLAFFVLFRFCCFPVFRAANVGVVDLYGLRCVLGPLHFLFMYHDFLTLFDKAWTEYGGSVVYSSTFNAGAEDFRTELTKIKDAAPDVIWCKATAEEFMTLGRQIVELGLDDVFIATDFQAVQDESIYDVIGSAVDGRLVYTRNGVANDDTTRAIYNAFESAYKDAYGVEPEAHICLLYDCIQLIVKAMETGSYSGDALRAALLGLQNEPGCCGYVTFDNFGRSEGSSTIAAYQNGGVEILNYSMTD